MTYADFAAISLTAATAVLAGAALFLALAAVVGYRAIKREAVKTSQEKAVESSLNAVRERLDEIVDKEVEKAIMEKLEPKLNEILETPEKIDELLTRLFERSVSNKQEELEPGFDSMDTEER